MASSAQAARARLFMQRCRQVPSQTSSARSASTLNDLSKYNPDRFGQKLRLQDRNTPLPKWRVANASLPSPGSSSTSDDLASSTPDATSSDDPSATVRETFDLKTRPANLPVPRYRHNPAMTGGFLGWVKYSVLRRPVPPNPRLLDSDTINPLLRPENNPYRTRKTWPPNLNALPEIRQFHYEKTFRRRLMLKVQNGRHGWDTATLFIRRYLILGVFLWFIFIATEKDPNQRNPTDSLRYWVYGKLRGLEGWIPQGMADQFEKQYQLYRIKHNKQWDPYNHSGWDETRDRNTLPNKTGKGSPPILNPLGDGTSKESLEGGL